MGAKPPSIPPRLSGNPDVGGDFSLYMVHKALPQLPNRLFCRPYGPQKRGQNLDGQGLAPYTSAVPGNGHDFGPPRGARCAAWSGDGRGFFDVTALRTDGQGPAGGSQGEPLEHQDQAPV